jgi:hypothetical protein
VLIFVVGAFLGGPLGLVARPSPQVPVAVAAAADRILQRPDHRAVTLHTASGEAGGSVVFDPGSRELVVLSGRLPEPAEGQRYQCYLERDGERTRIGPMIEAGEFYFWAGAVSEPEDALRPGDRFLVVDEASGEAVLTGVL